MRARTWRGGLLTIAPTATRLGLAASPDATSAPRWAPAATATIHPVVQMVIDGAHCTANCVLTRGVVVPRGYATHCAGTVSATDTCGCLPGSLPLVTKVTSQGPSRPGRLVYSSWLAMHQAR